MECGIIIHNTECPYNQVSLSDTKLKTVYRICNMHCRRYVKVPDDSEEWWKRPNKTKDTVNNGEMEYDEDDAAPATTKPQSSSSSSSTTSSTSSSVEKMENGSTNDNAAATGEDT